MRKIYCNKLSFCTWDSLFLSMLSFICAVYIISQSTVSAGLEWLFLLPLGMSAVCFLFGDVIAKWRSSISLFILILVLLARYVISPMLLVFSGESAFMRGVSAAGYRYGLCMSLIELATVIITLKLVWKPYAKTDCVRDSDDFKMTWCGWLVVFFLLALLIWRGRLPNVFLHITSLLNYSNARTPLDTYDMTAVMVLKSFFYLIIASWSKKKYEQNRLSTRNIYFFTALLAACLNVAFYEAESRSILLETIIATVASLFVLFPKWKKQITAIGIALAAVFLINSFLTFNFGGTIGPSNYLNSHALQKYSSTIMAYTNGVPSIGWAYDKYEAIRSSLGADVILSDLLNSINPLEIPGLSLIRNVVAGIPTTSTLFNSTIAMSKGGYIIPAAGQFLWYGGVAIGAILDILFYIVNTILFSRFCRLSNTQQNSANMFLYSFCSIIGALSLCYNLQITINCYTYIPLYLFILIKANDFGKVVVFRRLHKREDHLLKNRGL